MKFKFKISLLLFLSASFTSAAGLENRIITLKSNERFDLVQADTVTFKFQPLSEDARKLEITHAATALGVAYLGQVKLKENITALSALRSIADQIGNSLDISFGVIADSNTSEALKANELLLLYHPNVTITLALAKANEESDYEIICTYALRELSTLDAEPELTTPSAIKSPSQPVSELAPLEDITPVEDLPKKENK